MGLILLSEKIVVGATWRIHSISLGSIAEILNLRRLEQFMSDEHVMTVVDDMR